MNLFLRAVLGFLFVASNVSLAAEPHPRSVVVLDQSAKNAPWSMALQSSLLAKLNADPNSPVSVYFENLDSGPFAGAEHEENQRKFLSAKYKDIQVSVIVTFGAKSLEFVMRSRPELWSNVPVVFGGGEIEDAQVRGDQTVTGAIMQLPFRDLVASARIVMPNFGRLVVVGDPFERQPFRAHYGEEIATYAKDLNIIDLSGFPMVELKERLAALPDDSVIAYTNIYSDGRGMTYTSPREALAILTKVANRPIVVDAETFIGSGSVGGLVAMPEPVAEEAARTALRVLNGEAPSSIPITVGDFKKPIFDWRALQRWHIDVGKLPDGSEIRYRPLTAWEQYRAQIILIAVVLLMQAALIVGLLYERRRRRLAELNARLRLSELARVNRSASAGALSASIAHEVNQPLTAIVSNGNAALRWLQRNTPNHDEAIAALRSIVADGHRAGEIIHAVRAMFRSPTTAMTLLDIKRLVDEVLMLLRAEIQRHDVIVVNELPSDGLQIPGERTQLQQVILNLVMNAVEAIGSGAADVRMLRIRADARPKEIMLFIEDSGPGIAEENVNRIFDAFFTTKPDGMGMGLAICKSAIESAGGRLRALSNEWGGATLCLTLPRRDIEAI